MADTSSTPKHPGRPEMALGILKASRSKQGMTDLEIADRMLKQDITLGEPLAAPTKQTVKHPHVNRAQLALYRLRKLGLATKTEDGRWLLVK